MVLRDINNGKSAAKLLYEKKVQRLVRKHVVRSLVVK